MKKTTFVVPVERWMAALFALAVMYPISASAGWLLVQETTTTTSGKPTRVERTRSHYDHGKLRQERETDGEKSVLIFNGDAMYACGRPDGKKSRGVCVKTLSDGLLEAMESLRKGGAKMKFREISVSPTGAKQVIAGKHCRDYRITSDIEGDMMRIVKLRMKIVETTCFADFVDTGHMAGRFLQQVEKLAASLFDARTRSAFLKSKKLGAPLATTRRIHVRSTSMGRTTEETSTETMRTLSLSSVNAPAASFQVPHGYEVLDMPPPPELPSVPGLDSLAE